MRVLLLLCALVLAGCASPPPPVTSAPAPVHAAAVPAPEVLVDGTFKWHEYPTTPFGLFETVYNPVTQVFANPCLSGGQPYFSNRQLPVSFDAHSVPPGKLTVTLDWTDSDFAGKTLVAAFMAPGIEAYDETPYIHRGAPTEVTVAKGNSTGNLSWDFWLCINNSSSSPGDPDWQPGPFAGSVKAKILFTPTTG